MTASSQTPPGPEPTELPDDGRPLHDPAPLQAAIASYAEVIPAPGGPSAPESPDVAEQPPMPEGQRAAYAAYGVALPVRPAEQAPVTTLQAAAAVLDAKMAEDGSATGEELAEAERSAGILFDAAHVQAAVSAAREQTRAELAAELTQAQQSLDWFRERWQAIGRLCEGRPLEHMLEVSEVLAAADGRTPTDAPLTLIWNRGVSLPVGGTREARAIVECTTARGGRAALELTGEERQALAFHLDSEIVRDIYAPCPTEDCGTEDDLVASHPDLFGWSRIQVAGTDEPARWYCTPMCVSHALARAGAKLTEIDEQAELDGGL